MYVSAIPNNSSPVPTLNHKNPFHSSAFYSLILGLTMPRFRCSVAGLSFRRPGFDFKSLHVGLVVNKVQGGSNMTGTDLCVRLYKSVPVIFEPPCTSIFLCQYHFTNVPHSYKSLRDFRNRLRNNQDRHGRKEHINR